MRISFELNVRSVLRWILGLLLVWAALSKLADLQEFHGSLLAYKLPVPEMLSRWVAIVLPWLELLCGLMLLAGFWTEAALLWAAALFAIFVLATAQAWGRGLDISCGCFNLRLFGVGANGEPALNRFLQSVGFAFFRALLLAVAAVYLLRHHRLNPPSPAGTE